MQVQQTVGKPRPDKLPFLHGSPKAVLHQRVLHSMSFSEALIQIRTRHGLSRQEWAARSGITRTTLWRWESGKVMPRKVELESALNCLNLARHERQEVLRTWSSNRSEPVAQAAFPSELPLTHRGDMLVALRMRKGWTQSEAAERSGVPRVTLTKWENLVSWPSPERLHTLCYCYDASEEELLALTAPWTNEGEQETDLHGLIRQVEALDFREYTADGLQQLRLAGQLGKFPADAEIVALLTRVYTAYINYLINRLQFKESRIYLKRLAELPLASDPNILARRVITETFAINCETFLDNNPNPVLIGRRSFAHLKPYLPHLGAFSPLLQAQILGELSTAMRLQRRYDEALKLNQYAIQRAQSLVEREQAQRLNERLKILQAAGRHTEVLAAFPAVPPENLFYRTSMKMWRGFALLDLKSQEEGVGELTEANATAQAHEMSAMAKMIQDRLACL